MNTKKSIYGKFFKIVIFNTAFVAVLIFAYKNIEWGKLSLWSLNINYLYLFSAIAIYVLSMVLFSLGWLQIVKLYNKSINTPVHLSYLGAQLFKYLPSSLFLFSAQLMLNKKMQVGYKKSFAAFAIQYCFVFWSAAVLTLLFTGMWFGLFLVGCVFVLFMIILANRRKYKLPALADKLINFTDGHQSRLLLIAVLHLAAWSFGGLALHFTTLGLNSDINIVNSIAAQPLSASISILAVFAPGGIGVREYVLSSSGLSVNTIVVWRIITTIADVSVGTIALLLVRKTRN